MALKDSLISHWKLDEASGNALDAHGSNELTETSGTIASTAGKVGNCRDFEAGDTEHFERADNASLSTGDIDFTIALWVNHESDQGGAFPGIACKGSHSGNTIEWWLDYIHGTGLKFQVTTNGNPATTAAATAAGDLTLATWYYIVCWHDSVANTINIQVNDGSANSTAHSGGVADTSGAFILGQLLGLARYWDGMIDEVSFWKRVLTAAERTQLYNSGSGLSYDAWDAAGLDLQSGSTINGCKIA